MGARPLVPPRIAPCLCRRWFIDQRLKVSDDRWRETIAIRAIASHSTVLDGGGWVALSAALTKSHTIRLTWSFRKTSGSSLRDLRLQVSLLFFLFFFRFFLVLYIALSRILDHVYHVCHVHGEKRRATVVCSSVRLFVTFLPRGAMLAVHAVVVCSSVCLSV